MLGGYITFLESGMDYASKNNSVITNNIANYNTPDFKAEELVMKNNFENELKTNLVTTNESHIGINKPLEGIEYDLVQPSSHKTRYDRNNVDQTEEMIKLIKNNFMNNMGVLGINSELELFRRAIGN